MEKQRISVPYLSYDQLRQVAAQFLQKYHPKGIIPIPIEEIIDLQFEIDIIPTPGLHKGFDIDAFITSDLSSIYVDEFVYDSRPGRYRFSLAHELAHLLLHKDVFRKMRFSTIAEWKKVMTEFPEKEYGYLEWQAYALAGLILVPPDPLAERFEKAISHLYKVGLSLETATEAARCMIEGALAEDFKVSAAAIGKRVASDNLWQRK
jgi:hypothetical protein